MINTIQMRPVGKENGPRLGIEAGDLCLDHDMRMFKRGPTKSRDGVAPE
jgi:hypothetical protein